MAALAFSGPHDLRGCNELGSATAAAETAELRGMLGVRSQSAHRPSKASFPASAADFPIHAGKERPRNLFYPLQSMWSLANQQLCLRRLNLTLFRSNSIRRSVAFLGRPELGGYDASFFCGLAVHIVGAVAWRRRGFEFVHHDHNYNSANRGVLGNQNAIC